MTGSINDDSGFTIEKPLFVGDKGTVNSDISGRKFTKTVVGSASPEYPETEITFDNFSLRSNTRKVEMTQEGLLIYNSEDSFLKMTGAGIEFRGGSGLATFGQAINRESFTNDSQIAGTLAAPALQAYASDPEDIGTTASDGNVGEFAKGNHRHRLTSGTLDTVLASTSFSSSVQGRFVNVTAGTGLTGGGSSGTITLNVVGGAGITANANDITVDSTVIRTTGAQSLGGIKTFSDEIQATGGLAVTGAVTASTNISASLTGSFGHILINGSPLQAATGTNTGDVSLAGSRNYITLGANQVITVGEVDISDDTNLATGNGITLSGDTLSTNDSQIVHDNLSGFVANEHVDHSTVSISAGSGLTGGGTILANRTIHVGAGTGITVNSNDIATNDSEIVHDNLSGFVANEHIDHSGVSVIAGSGLTGGGTIAASRTLNIGAGTGVTVNANDIAIGQAIGTGNSPSFAGLTVNGSSTFNIDGDSTFSIVDAGTNAVFLKSAASDEIYFGSNNTWQLRFTTGGTAIYIGDNVDFLPSTDGNSDLGSSSLRFRDVFTDAITVTNNITVGGTVDGRNISTDGTKLDGIAANADNFNKVKIAGDNNASGNDVTSGQAFTIAGGTGITTAIASRTATIAITADSVGDAQLAFNTGQHLTTTSNVTFDYVNTANDVNVGGSTRGQLKPSGTYAMTIHKVKHMSFNWNADYDYYSNHGIASTDESGNFTDDMTINSFDDIHLKVDTNSNDGPAYVNVYNNGTNVVGRWGYDGTNNILYHAGRVGIGSESPAHALDVNGDIIGDSVYVNDTNTRLQQGGGNALRIQTNSGYIDIGPMNGALAHIYTDRSAGFFFDKDIGLNTGKQIQLGGYGTYTMFVTPTKVSGSATSTGSFGRLDAHEIVADGSGTPFTVQGTSGSLFSVSDSFSGSLMSVSDVSGIPILEVFDDDRIVMGSYSSPAMTITGSNVGIGTDNPTQKLHIHGGGMYLQTGQVITWNNGDATIGAVSGYHFAISTYTGTALTEKLRVTSTGNVGIGDTSPSFKLDVNGTSRVTGVARFDSTMQFNGNQTIETVGGSDSLYINPQANLHLGTNSTDHTYIGAASRNVTINATTTTINNTLAASTINASGNISSTATSGNNTFNSSILIAAGKNLFLDGGSNTYIKESSADVVDIYTGGTVGLKVNASEIQVQRYITHAGDTNTYIDFETDTIGFVTAGSDRLKITSDGKIGIGTSAPGVAKLSVFSTTNTEPFLYVGDGTPNNDGSWDSNIMLDSSIHSRIRVEQRADNKNLEIYAHTGQNPRIRATDSATGFILGVGGTTSLTIGTSPYLTVHGNTTISGNITVTGTVDGRDIASDGTKLDGIEANAKNDQTITAGSGLTGGGTGDVTLNIGAGTGIDVAADAISVDVSDFMTNGSDNRVVTATGTDAMNAEANLTFNGSNGQLQITAGSSGALFAEYNNGMTLWLDGSNGDFTGGDYFGIHAYSTTDLAFSYAGTARMTIKSGGNVGLSLIHI